MTQILAISGKKQGGKTTAMNFLFGSAMKSLELVDYAHINENGDLIVPGIGNNDEIIPIIFPVETTDSRMTQYIASNVWPSIKNYSFADMLKATCINVLGLTTEQCYGTNAQKDSPTHLIWKNMPGFPKSNKNQWLEKHGFEVGSDWTPNSFMTARHVLQYVGTEIFRKMYSQVWVDSSLRRVVQDQPQLALFTDCRFPNEVEGVQAAGGKVIRFTREPFSETDTHSSETSLDRDVYDWDNFDYVIDNADMSIAEQNEAFYNVLSGWNFIGFESLATYVENSELLSKEAALS